MKIYLAGPLFTEAQRDWLLGFKKELERAGYGVTWPYELFGQTEIESWGKDAPARIMQACRCALEQCDMVAALLDGPQVDDGTAWELGWACAKGMPTVGIRTDARRGEETPYSNVNAMIAGSCECIASDSAALIAWLGRRYPPVMRV